MGEIAAAYAGCRERIVELAMGREREAATIRVPCCPEWSVHDVVAHVAGVVDDALAGRLEGAATEGWTATQVAARRGRPLGEIVEEWTGQAPAFEGLLDAVGAPGRQAVADVVTHEHDIRGALRSPGARTSDAVGIGLAFVGPGLVAAAAARGVALRVESNDGWHAGDDDADVYLRGDAFELLRAMTGRRSISQLRALDWKGDAEPVLPAFTFGPFRPADERVEE